MTAFFYRISLFGTDYFQSRFLLFQTIAAFYLITSVFEHMDWHFMTRTGWHTEITFCIRRSLYSGTQPILFIIHRPNVFRTEYRLWDHTSERIIKRSGNWRVCVPSIWKFSFTRILDIETWDYVTYWSSKWGKKNKIKIACGRNCWYSRLISLSDLNSFLVKCNTYAYPWRGKLRTRDRKFRLI